MRAPAERVLCPAPHLYGPPDPAAWKTWAASMAAQHDLRTCPDCRLPVIWEPRTPTAPDAEQDGLFDQPPEVTG